MFFVTRKHLTIKILFLQWGQLPEYLPRFYNKERQACVDQVKLAKNLMNANCIQTTKRNDVYFYCIWGFLRVLSPYTSRTKGMFKRYPHFFGKKWKTVRFLLVFFEKTFILAIHSKKQLRKFFHFEYWLIKFQNIRVGLCSRNKVIGPPTRINSYKEINSNSFFFKDD